MEQQVRQVLPGRQERQDRAGRRARQALLEYQGLLAPLEQPDQLV
jgi:hypothetical protein